MVILTTTTEAEDSLLESLFSPPKNNYCAIEQDKSSNNSENNDDDETGGSGISNEEEDSSSNSSSNSNTSDDDGKGGSATIVSTTISMTKNLLGAGVLSLSSGIALFSTSTTKRNGNTDGNNSNGEGDSDENDDDDRLVASTQTAIIISISIILLLGILFGYFCLLIAKVCEKTNSNTYRDCWEKTIGKSSNSRKKGVWTRMSGILVSIVCMLLPAQGNIASAVVLSETFQSLLSTFFTSYDIKVELSRTICLLILTFVVFIPMCLMKDINALSGFSMVGVMGMIIVTISMVIRCFDGSYQPGGMYYYIEDSTDNTTTEQQQQQFYPEQHEHRQHIIHNKYDLPSSSSSISLSSISASFTVSFSLVNLYKDRMMKILPFVCMVFNSCIMHYNTPRFYMELKDRSIRRFTICVIGAFGLSAILSVIIGICGYVTFHTDDTNGLDQRPPTSISSYILNNYSSYDKLAIISRIGIFISTLLMYPLAFFGVRDGFWDIYQGIMTLVDSSSINTNNVQGKNNNNHNNKESTINNNTNNMLISFLLLFLLTVGAIVFNDLGLINAVGGGTLATLLCIFFPVIMYREAVRNNSNTTTTTTKNRKDTNNDDDAEQQQQQQQQYLDSTTPIIVDHKKKHIQVVNTAEIQESDVALFLMVIGILLGTLGVYQSLVSSSSSSSSLN